MKELDVIEVRGAREHNLQSIDVTLPKKQLIVFTNVSGSGKSSLAFDTIFAEGQRRYVESLSLLAPIVENRKGRHQQHLDQLRKAGFARVRFKIHIVQTRRSAWFVLRRYSSSDIHCWCV